MRSQELEYDLLRKDNCVFESATYKIIYGSNPRNRQHSIMMGVALTKSWGFNDVKVVELSLVTSAALGRKSYLPERTSRRFELTPCLYSTAKDRNNDVQSVLD